MSQAIPHHIIAIGASAGGMEEIITFFDHTPMDGVSYVIVQHLSADFKSRMVELLARHSKLTVTEAVNGIVVKNNEVYLIPSNKYMTIKDGSLYLTDKKENAPPHLTINTFFSSLAEEYGSKSIGIILSGLGTDGTEGIIAIKNAGGMVIARDPATSEFSSMPSHAIATGLVDFILEPAMMPQAIENYIEEEEELIFSQKEEEMNLTAIIDLIKENSALDVSDYKHATILRRTKRRAGFCNFETMGLYLDYLRKTPAEIEILCKEFLISVTSFFRDKQAFDIIEKEVLPETLKSLGPGEELKVWVAGCATGEEAYSIAILIAEQLTGNLKNTVVKIFATDMDSYALLHAGKGVYGKGISKNISSYLLEKYFIEEDSGYKVKPSIRKMVIFALHDMVKNPPYCNMHLISCRNLLIYMAPVLQKKIFSMLLFGLKRDAYLFLGSSENPVPILDKLQVVDKKWRIYKNLESSKAISLDFFSLPELLETKNIRAYPEPRHGAVNETLTLGEAMHDSLAVKLGYLAICIDEDHHVIKSYGDTSKYLLQKNFISNLQELLPKPVAVAFNILCRKVLNTGEVSVLSGIVFKSQGHVFSVNLSVSPLMIKGGQRLLLVTFQEDVAIGAVKTETIFNEDLHKDQYIFNLEQELKELKDKLAESGEELNGTIENMQSFNEEIISANEEMQSTNEEMQSVNEELHTINADYQLKNKELLEINDDLNNYFRSNLNGQLFVNKDLLLMKFSPGTVKQINLLDSDIGRPLSNISTNIKLETIIDDVKKVIEEGIVLTKEVETNNGKWYQIMTMPYIRLPDHNNDGAIITFNDITLLKNIQQELDISNKALEIAINSASLGIWSIDVRTREFVPSQRLKEIFGFLPEEEISYKDAIAQIVGDYKKTILDSVEECICTGGNYDMEYPIKRHDDNVVRWLRAVGNISKNNDGSPAYFTGVIQDITEQKLGNIRKNDFIALVSHELNTPLTIIQAYIQILAERALAQDDSFARESLSKAIAQVKKMSGLIKGFLNMACLEAGRIYLSEELFEIGALINETLEGVSVSTPGNAILFEPYAPVWVYADRDKIGQVINNLLINAVKYSPEINDIGVRFKEHKGMLEVSVRDNGIGIKGTEQEKLFDRYHRVENEHTKSISGFGLGLYLSAEIIQRHKGKIWVESVHGKGSTFFFSLPLPQSADNTLSY
ncbi:PAS domain-containing protein [Taibaiella lutea]|uniref:histidine kinase n=1 Tax=Taibaiella lutea TaxID=2608001 RepID=A0A5M6CP61_9BACT|nr:chemotaxis protein CheB [Taibaiella lutea]KAA5536190.1 PAS domain-containing protein [Taibaiella lutea]